MEKYLGNKTALLPIIFQFIAERVPEASSISDLFSGTTNVSRFFRRSGFDVASGDTNRFSYVLAHAYLTCADCPRFENVDGPFEVADYELLRLAANAALPVRDRRSNRRSLEPLARALAVLQHAAVSNVKPGIFFDFFCASGCRATFKSLRGGSGRRNYFSEQNALFVDGALNALRLWFREGRVSRSELFLLLASVIEEVVIIANVSGTFHDFNRKRLWPNSLQRFTLRFPPLVLSNCRAEIANADALDMAQAIAPHSVCYIDPPYNFRQYGAYYHLLNFLAAFPFLEDLQAYTESLSFVRGQNMLDDYTSTFCFRDSFISSLRSLIERVPSQHVVLSYYGGRNHWNHWSVTDRPTDRGLRELSALFRDRALFDECEIVPALNVRQNFQSRVGERKAMVNEYLLLGSRVRVPAAVGASVAPLSTNLAIGVAEHFGHFVSRGKQQVARAGAPGKLAVAV